MSWLFSQALVEEYLGENSLDGELSAPLSGSHTQQAYCAPDKMTVFSRLSRFGMTYKPLTEDRGKELLTSYLEAFHAKTLAQQEKAQESTENGQECGEKWHGSFVKWNQDSSLWKTHQCSLLGDLDEFSETWPQWGLMRDGECWEQQTLEQTIRGTGFGLSQSTKIPTPTASMMPCEGTVRIMRKAWQNGEFTLEEASAIAGRDVRKKQGKVPEMWPTPQTRGFTNDGDLIALAKMCDSWKEMSAMAYRASEKKKLMHWPTPRTKGMCGGTGSWELLNKNTTKEEARQMGAGNGGTLNPTWVEWLMGWPLEWTDLKPLEMDKFQQWQRQHGDF